MPESSLHCPTCAVHVDEHEASRCMDDWVAEKVMGWQLVYDEWMQGREPTYQPNEWHPSRFMDAAWDVVEKIAQRCILIIDCVPSAKSFVVHLEDFEHKVRAEADTAPLAICRAAIKAKAASADEEQTIMPCPSNE